MSETVGRRTFRRETLRIRFRDFFAILFAASVCLGNGLVWYATDAASAVIYVAVVPAAVAVLAGVAVLVLRRQFTVGLSPQGIRCCDFWGRYHLAGWDTIRAADVWHLLGLPYLRIESRAVARPLWMSLSLEDERLLPELLASYVERGHPIRTAIEGRYERPH